MKQMLVAACAAALSTWAAAGPIEVQFGWSNVVGDFDSPMTSAGDPFDVKGTLVGEDFNADGFLTQDEISSASFWGSGPLSPPFAAIQYSIGGHNFETLNLWADTGELTMFLSAGGSGGSLGLTGEHGPSWNWDLGAPGVSFAATSIALPVPEPSSVALLLAGMGAIAAAGRRKARRSDPAR